jgi:hypothetical protein
MDVIINEVKTTIRLADGNALLAPETVGRIAEVVLAAVRREMAREARRADERRITAGSTHWLQRRG